MTREPYLVTVIRCIADLEAKGKLDSDEIYRLNSYRRWLGTHYPEVSAALATEYMSLHASQRYASA